MDKIITYEYGDHNSEVLELLHPGHLTKKANYSENLIEFIKKLLKKENQTYALVNALSAGEYYGSNKNGDYFPEDSLKEYHKTFEALGHVYRHHVNKDPQKSMGKVVFSNYNPKMRRVELILELDNLKSKDILERLEAGQLPAVSMGCKVPFDVCSICGNRAKTRAQYCKHLLNDMSTTYSDGRRVYAINTMPKFFDLSVVTIPADRTAGFINKVASDQSSPPVKLERTEMESEKNWSHIMTKSAQMEAKADIKKRIIGKVDDIIITGKDKDRLMEPFLMDKKKIEKLAEYPFKTVLSTCLGLGLLPHRADFQKLALYDQGLHGLAHELEENNEVFDVNSDTDVVNLEGITFDNFHDEVAEVLKDEMVGTGATKEASVARGLLKLADDSNEWSQIKPGEPGYLRKTLVGTPDSPPNYTSHKNPAVPMGLLASLYYSYSKLMFDDKTTKGFKRFLTKRPWVLPLMVGAGTIGTLKAQEHAFDKLKNDQMNKKASYPMAATVSIPLSYYFSAVNQEKARLGIPISKKEDFTRKHPAVVSFLGTLAGGKALKGVGKSMKGLSKSIKNLSKKRKSSKKSWFSKRASQNFSRDYSAEIKVGNLVNRLDAKSLDTMYNDLVHN